ncbi:MAG: hypothetical protein IPM02_18400 [Betaproteobacteria bacterium]|nr:hypothetical protein [Betaproteobacteria bacterium]
MKPTRCRMAGCRPSSSRSSQQMVFDVYRWLANGQTDLASLPHAQIAIATVDGNSDPNSLDTLPLGDGRTLIVIDQASQRIVLRLSANGSRQPSIGSVRIDGNPASTVLMEAGAQPDGRSC